MRKFFVLLVAAMFVSTGIAEAKHVRSYKRRGSGKYTRSYERSKANKSKGDNFSNTQSSRRHKH